MIRVGTRASALALAQAEWVAGQLEDDAELVRVSDVDRADKSRWVSALERALLEDEIDVAVHSAKDVPADLAEGLALVAFPPREDARDAICGAGSLGELSPGARVGTSSLRRAAQIRAVREDVEVVDVRGNVDTRLRKLGGGDFDALVLAAAGLRRLGLDADGILHELVPAAGQGALALEARPGTVPADGLVDADTTACVLAERELTRALDASCNTPVGAHAVALGDGRVRLKAWVGRSDGSGWLADTQEGPPDGLGRAVAERMISCGARDLLQ